MVPITVLEDGPLRVAVKVRSIAQLLSGNLMNKHTHTYYSYTGYIESFRP